MNLHFQLFGQHFSQISPKNRPGREIPSFAFQTKQTWKMAKMVLNMVSSWSKDAATSNPVIRSHWMSDYPTLLWLRQVQICPRKAKIGIFHPFFVVFSLWTRQLWLVCIDIVWRLWNTTLSSEKTLHMVKNRAKVSKIALFFPIFPNFEPFFLNFSVQTRPDWLKCVRIVRRW